jgi:predicted nuclease with TOPRIM domain
VAEESFPEQFKELENKIEILVQTCRDLRQTKSQLEAKIENLEDALRNRMAAEHQYVEEKSMIRGKIGDLLGRLDQVLAAE